MTEQHRLRRVGCNVHDHDRIDIDEYSLIPNNHLSAIFGPIVNKHLNISNIQLVLEFYNKFRLGDIFLIEFENIKSELCVLSIAENVELPGLALEFNVLDQAYIVHVIDVNLLFALVIDVEAIISRGYHECILLIIDVKINWLPLQWVFELIDCLDVTHIDVQDEDLALVREHNGLSVITLGADEVELAAHLVKGRVLPENYSLSLNELVLTTPFIWLPLEKVELVELLLCHDQILSSNYRQVMLIRALLHSEDLIRLPLHALHQLNGDLVYLLKGVRIIHP